jgi:hypothetical protein
MACNDTERYTQVATTEVVIDGRDREVDNRGGGSLMAHIPQFTETERLLLWQNETILASVAKDKDWRSFHERRALILKKRFESRYAELFEPIDEKIPFTDEMESEFLEILDMFTLGKTDATFGGFDFNDDLELKYHVFLEFLQEDDRYTELKNVNSHGRRLAHYQEKSRAWIEAGKPRRDTEAQKMDRMAAEKP